MRHVCPGQRGLRRNASVLVRGDCAFVNGAFALVTFAEARHGLHFEATPPLVPACVPAP